MTKPYAFFALALACLLALAFASPAVATDEPATIEAPQAATAPALEEIDMPAPDFLSPVTYCVGSCSGAEEFIYLCDVGDLARYCCRKANHNACPVQGAFSGICYGDSEIVCQ